MAKRLKRKQVLADRKKAGVDRNKLLKLSQTETDLRMIHLGADMIEVEVPKKWIRVNPPRKLSEQTRLELKERMLALRESQGQNTEEGGKNI